MSINSILSPSTPRYPSENIKTPKGQMFDYRHAARIFTDDNFRLSPKYGFLFYVEFDFNPQITNISNTTAQELGMIVKSVDLPKYTVETKTHNAYNRKNIVQNAIKYDQVNITFHDDQADNVRNFWYDYYSFYYRDPDYADAAYYAPHKYQNRIGFDWGYTPKPSIGYNTANGNQPYQYIQSIRIYSLYQKNFSEYELINPIITSFKHGEHNNEGSAATMTHTMTVQFETVKYYYGYVTENTVGGFLDLHYDHTKSPIAPAQGTNLVDDNTGGFRTANDKITDLAYVNMVNPLAAPTQYTSPVPPFAGDLSKYTAFTATYNTFNTGGYSIPGTDPTTTGTQASVAQQITGGFNRFVAGSAGGNSGTIGGSFAGASSIPAISLNGAPGNNALFNQQLTAGVNNTVSQATTAVVGGTVKGISAGLGVSNSTIGMVAAAASNPQAYLRTAENAALNVGVAYVNQAVSSYVQGLSKTVATSVSGALGDLNSQLAFGGAGTFTGGVQASIQQAGVDLGIVSDPNNFGYDTGASDFTGISPDNFTSTDFGQYF
jgi:hypothetical protein